MGTRGTITIIFKGKRLRLYNHGDSYPSELGADLIRELKDLLSRFTVDQLIEMLNRLKLVSRKILPTEKDVKALEPWTDLAVGSGSVDDWYCLLRGCQGSLTEMLESGYANTDEINNQEYNYVIDFDHQVILLKEEDSGYSFSTLDKCPW